VTHLFWKEVQAGARRVLVADTGFLVAGPQGPQQNPTVVDCQQLCGGIPEAFVTGCLQHGRGLEYLGIVQTLALGEPVLEALENGLVDVTHLHLRTHFHASVVFKADGQRHLDAVNLLVELTENPHFLFGVTPSEL